MALTTLYVQKLVDICPSHISSKKRFLMGSLYLKQYCEIFILNGLFWVTNTTPTNHKGMMLDTD